MLASVVKTVYFLAGALPQAVNFLEILPLVYGLVVFILGLGLDGFEVALEFFEDGLALFDTFGIVIVGELLAVVDFHAEVLTGFLVVLRSARGGDHSHKCQHDNGQFLHNGIVLTVN